MVVDIDGSILEGGGQILRISMALSTLRQKPIRIFKIRANRSVAGLAPQHLTGIRLIRDLCDGKLENDALRSTEISFKPEKVKFGKFDADTQTGGSVALILQAALPCAFFGSDEISFIVKGGTNAYLAPPIDYVNNILKPSLEKFGAEFRCEIMRRGFFQGNGIINVKVFPVNNFTPIELINFGDVESIYGEAYVSGILPVKMANEMKSVAENILRKIVKTNISIKSTKFTKDTAFGNGSGINLYAKTTTGCYLGSCYLGKKGVSIEEVASKAAEDLLESITKKICADQKLQDQLIIYMALAKGKSRVKVGPITSHTETAIYISELLTEAKFNIIKNEDGTNVIECEGVGHDRSYSCT